MMKIVESTRHGKAVKGTKKTSTIQVREPFNNAGDYLLKKEFRFTVGDSKSKARAMKSAEKYVQEQGKS